MAYIVKDGFVARQTVWSRSITSNLTKVVAASHRRNFTSPLQPPPWTLFPCGILYSLPIPLFVQRTFPTPLLLCLLLTLPWLGLQAQSGSRPNVLMIVVDDLNDYQSYLLDGHPQAETPNLDRLARNGTTFQSAYCSSPKSCPSRTSFMSGKWPTYTGVLDNDGIQPVFRDNFQLYAKDTTVFTLPEVLRDSGYYTVGINKVYFGWKNPLFDNDFDTLTLDPCNRGKSWSDFIVFAPDQRLIDYEDEGIPGFIWSQVDDTVEALMFDRAAADTALHILENYSSNPAAYCNRPLFLTLGIFLPHKPLIIPERHFRKDYVTPTEFFEVPFDIPYNTPVNTWPPNGVVMPPQPDPIHADYYAMGEFGQDLAKGGDQASTFDEWPDSIDPKPIIDPAFTEAERNFAISESMRANAVTAYLAGVRFADYQIGRVLDALEDLGIADNTIIIFTSDHGYSLGEKRHWHKFGPWDTDMRIPLVVKDPRRSFGGSVYSPVSLVDMFPTILDLVGIQPPTFADGSRYLDGESLKPFLDNPGLTINRPIISALRKPKGGTECFATYSVRDQEFHYIRYQGLLAPNPNICDTGSTAIEEELYRVGQYRDIDPNEWNNLINDPRYQDVRDHLSQFVVDSALFSTVPPSVQIDMAGTACAYTYTDTISLTATLFRPSGELWPGIAPGLTFHWKTSLDPGTVFTTKDLSVAVADLMDTATFAAGDEFLIYAEVIEDLTNLVLAQDVKSLRLNADRFPDNTFNAVVTSNLVSIQGVTYTEPEAIRRYIWTFGDGSGSDKANPGQHIYSAPGSYLIKCFVEYGNDTANLCRRNFQQTVIIDALGFNDDNCLAPQNVGVDAVGIDRAKITWNPVYGSQGYQLRGRLRTGLDTAYKFIVLPSNAAQLKRLPSDQSFEIQVRTLCDVTLGLTPTSGWSYPMWFTTEQCFPPRDVTVSNETASSVVVSWQGNPAAINGYVITYGKTAAALTNIVVATEQITLTGLDSATTYYFKVRSRCEDLFGGGLQVGPQSELLSFSTTGGSPRLTDTESDPQLSVFPNPSYQYFTVAWEHTGTEPVTLRITDLLGRVLETRVVDASAGFAQQSFDRNSRPAGLYLVSLQRANAVYTRRFTIAD